MSTADSTDTDAEGLQAWLASIGLTSDALACAPGSVSARWHPWGVEVHIASPTGVVELRLEPADPAASAYARTPSFCISHGALPPDSLALLDAAVRCVRRGDEGQYRMPAAPEHVAEAEPEAPKPRRRFTDVPVVMVSGDTPQLTRRALLSLRAHVDGPVELIDVSQRSHDALASVAREVDARVRRVASPPQLYAHALAIDVLAAASPPRYAIWLDSDCFVHDDRWWTTLTDPLAREPAPLAVAPARATATSIETWSMLLDMQTLGRSGLSAMPFTAEPGRRLDTLDLALSVLHRAAHPVVHVELSAFALHLEAITLGRFLLALFDRNREDFLRVLHGTAPPSSHDGLLDAVCRSYEVLTRFGDADGGDPLFAAFVAHTASEARLARVRAELAADVLPTLQRIGARHDG